jgi:hypothetical protein
MEMKPRVVLPSRDKVHHVLLPTNRVSLSLKLKKPTDNGMIYYAPKEA